MLVLACVTSAAGVGASAQDTDQPADPVVRLIDQRPFDQLVLNAANGNSVLNVFPLEFPNRAVPSPFPAGKLQVRLLDRPAQLFDVEWSDIAEIRLFEYLLLQEATRLTNQGEFDQAFDYFNHLLQSYPQLPGLSPAAERYLQQDALAAFKAEKFERALAVLLSLYERNPQFGGLAKAVDSVGGKIIEKQLAARQFDAARATLELLSSQFPKLTLDTVPAWRQRFVAAAAQKVAAARELAAANKFPDARRTIRQATSIWPEAENATELLASIDAAFPLISVGVFESAPSDLTPRLDSWSSLRSSRLTQRSLTELVDYGSEGGIYVSPLGTLAQDTAGTTVTLQIDPQSLEAGAVAAVAASVSRMLLSMPDADGHELVGRLAAVRLEFPDKIHADFVARHVRPEALLQLPLPGEIVGRLSSVVYQPSSREANAVRFEKVGDGTAGVRCIEEVTFSDDDAAIAALLRGEIDVLERIPPWQLSKLRERSDVQVGTYRLPTVHVLLPNPQSKLANQREFRRALVYGIDRERILKDVLLGGESIPGFQTLSGPFPAGVSQSDPARYAYNSQIQLHPYDPRLASLLATVAWNTVQKSEQPKDGEEKVEEPPDAAPMPTLRLAHSSDPVARTACQSIKLQLGAIGIPIELVEVTTDGDQDYDLRYAEISIWEPLVDAARVLGINGIAGVSTDYMIGALGKLDSATTWNQVQAALYGIHELAHNDLPVIPLWQTVNYFAYRRDLQGIAESPVVLYQDVGKWQRVIGTAQVR
ncbi:MAG: ABC transporter substrate-binding protein [Pirellulales bacterium]